MKTNEFDSIIFDCDGVLIDVTKSYDVTINKTISYVLKEIANITVDTPLTNEILLKFKSTGGFNDEIDITYSGILCFIAAKKLNKDPAELILDVLNNADDTGITYIEDFLNKIDVDIADIKSRLGYPSTDKNDLIHSTFDQLFFGPELYNKIFQKKSNFSEKGFIENDNVIVDSELIEALKKKFNDKIAIVTGRGFNAISSSLIEILNQFNVENSVFVVATNMCGTHNSGRKTYGHSILFDPWGETENKCLAKEKILNTTIDLNEISRVRSKLPSIYND